MSFDYNLVLAPAFCASAIRFLRIFYRQTSFATDYQTIQNMTRFYVYDISRDYGLSKGIAHVLRMDFMRRPFNQMFTLLPIR